MCRVLEEERVGKMSRVMRFWVDTTAMAFELGNDGLDP